MEQKLFLVHLGYYDPELSNGVYESHINLFFIGISFEDVRDKVKLDNLVQNHKMHIDGIQLIEKVNGHKITIDKKEGNATEIMNHNFRELSKTKQS